VYFMLNIWHLHFGIDHWFPDCSLQGHRIIQVPFQYQWNVTGSSGNILDFTLMLRFSEPFFISFMNNISKLYFVPWYICITSVFYRWSTKILYNPYSENPSMVVLVSPSLGTSHCCRAPFKMSPSISVNHKCQCT